MCGVFDSERHLVYPQVTVFVCASCECIDTIPTVVLADAVHDVNILM